MKNANYWMEYLERLADGQEKGEITHSDACEMNNTVGKVIAFAKVQLEAQRMRDATKSMRMLPMLEMEDGQSSEDNKLLSDP